MTNSGHSLIFAWGKHQAGLATAIGFFFFSVCVHLLGFYVFHVVYQPEVSLPPTSARITILPAAPELSMFGRWLEAEDPSIAATPTPVVPDFSWISLETQGFSGSPEGEVKQPTREVVIDMAKSLLNLVPPPRFVTPTAPRTVPSKGKLLSAFVDVQGKTIATPGLAFDETGAPALRAKFMVGIDAFGIARFVFTEKSSGSAKADLEVIEALKGFRLENPGTDLIWETAQVVWSLSTKKER